MAKTFKLSEVQRVAKEIAKNARFPINGPDDLIEAIGGPKGKVKFHGREHGADEVRNIPAEYFPILGEADLFTKIADLRGGRDVRDEEDLKPAKAVDRPADAPKPPDVSGLQLPKGKSVPGAVGR